MSQKALDSHSRSKHGARSDLRKYVGSDAVCPACRVKFSTHLQALAHLSDKRSSRSGRRVPCATTLAAGGFPTIPQDELDRLDELDRVSRRDAQRSGLTTPRTQGRPKRLCLDQSSSQRGTGGGVIDPEASMCITVCRSCTSSPAQPQIKRLRLNGKVRACRQCLKPMV